MKIISHFSNSVFRKLKYLLLIVIVCTNFSFGQLELQNAFPNLNFNSALFLTNSNDGTNRIFVIEQNGIIKVFPNSSNGVTSKTFLDITDKVASGGELGLLGLTFHPNYEINGYFYVNYTADNPLRTIISRFQVTSNPDSADMNSEFEVLTFTQPYSNHNGGWMGFGPNDGYLYIAVGDGGSGGDPQNYAQRLNTLLGKILRIDIDGGTPYLIPPTNPFVDSTNVNVRKEIYAWGLRNPWRCSFDHLSGLLYAGDVGQGAWEEIDIIENGKNYGWRCYEGNHPYNLSECNYPEYTFPIWEYSHGLGYSITGGYVYRGANVPELFRKYIYADYVTRKVWALTNDGGEPVNQLLLTAPGSVTSFGIDEFMELYIVSFDGNIYKFNSTSSCYTLNLNSGWNLVSVPFENNNMTASNIFPNSGSDVYGYSGAYFVADTLINGAGYWVKYSNAQNLQVCGTQVTFPIEVNSGWNLIGPFDNQVDIQNISSNPPNIIIPPFYEYNSGYSIAVTLKQGKGYWVKTNSPGVLYLNSALRK